MNQHTKQQKQQKTTKKTTTDTRKKKKKITKSIFLQREQWLQSHLSPILRFFSRIENLMVIEFSLAICLVVGGLVTNPVWKQFLNYTRTAVADTQFQISDLEFVYLYKLTYTPWCGISNFSRIFFKFLCVWFNRHYHKSVF